MSQPQPYIGPKPFGLEDQHLFFGRDREENDLLALIQAHPVVVLYAQSGAGKTSLLEAKLVPELYSLKAEVFRAGRVGGHLPPSIEANQVDNVFVFNAVMTLRPNPREAAELTKTKLPEAFGSPKGLETEEEPFRVAIFDQFEEIFTSYPERWEDRKGFFEQAAQALKADPFLHVVFAIREEYLASMLPYANEVPGRLRIGLRLERLRREAALEAVVNPLQATNRRFATDAAELLVDSLISTAEYIEPLHLQVVCRNLWQSLDPATQLITRASIQTYGDLDAALRGYYEECIAKTVSAKSVAEVILRNWFATELILPGNKRNLVYQGSENTAGLSNDVIKLLDEQHLIRGELRGGTLWYEIAHDRFVRPIVESNAAWQQSNDAIGFGLLEAAQRWEAGKRAPQSLLEGVGLNEAREWRAGPGEQIWRLGGLVREFIEASESRDLRRRATVRLYQLVFLPLVVLCFLLFFLMKAKSAEKTAEKARAIAESLRNQAEQTKLGERGLFASSLVESRARRARQLDALVWGIKAMGPAIAEGPVQSLPPEARKGLEDALRPLANAILFVTAPKSTPQFFPDYRHLLVSYNGKLDLFDASTGAFLWHKDLAEDVDYFDAAVAPDSSYILVTAWSKEATSSKSGTNSTQESLEVSKRPEKRVWLLDAMTGDPVQSKALLELTGGFFDWTGTQVIGWKEMLKDQYQIRIVDVRKQEVLREIDAPGLKYLTISKDGKLLACLTADKGVQFWNISDQSPPRTVHIEPARNTDWPTLRFSPDGRLLVAAFKETEKRLAIFDSTSARQVASSKDAFAATAASFSADSRTIVVLAASKIFLVDSTTGETKAAHEFGNNYERFFSNDVARALCIGPSDYELARLVLIDLVSGTTAELPRQPIQGDRLAASDNLESVATVDSEGIGRIFSVSKPPAQLTRMSNRELLGLACRQLLRMRPEHGDVSDPEVTAICLDRN